MSCKWVRALSSIDESRLDFPYRKIMDMCPENALVSFNLGTPGDEQKISMLGIFPKKTKAFSPSILSKIRLKHYQGMKYGY